MTVPSTFVIDAPGDAARAAELRRVKALATLVLAGTLAVFITAKSLLHVHPVFGFVAAFAEAATIGGLADWYAVVALFRRPLGLPIPHTAIIQSNQHRIADKLGEFIEVHFLEAAPVDAKLRQIDFGSFIADWLRDRKRSTDLARFTLRLLPEAVSATETSGLMTFITRRISTQLQSIDLLAILDAFGNLHTQRDAFAVLIRRRAAVETEKSTLIVDEKTYAQQLDLLRFQVHEITGAKLRPDEAEEVEQEHTRASNAAKLLELSQSAVGLLTENDQSLLTQTGALGRVLQDLQRIDAGAAPLVELHEQSAATLRELGGALSHYADRIDLDPGRLQELEERLNLIHSLRRKYGATLADVIAFGADAQNKLQSLEARDAELARLNGALEKLDAEISRAGKELSAARKKLIPKLSKAVAEAKAEEARKRAEARLAEKIDDEEIANVSAALAHSLAQLKVKRRGR